MQQRETKFWVLSRPQKFATATDPQSQKSQKSDPKFTPKNIAIPIDFQCDFSVETSTSNDFHAHSCKKVQPLTPTPAGGSLARRRRAKRTSSLCCGAARRRRAYPQHWRVVEYHETKRHVTENTQSKSRRGRGRVDDRGENTSQNAEPRRHIS